MDTPILPAIQVLGWEDQTDYMFGPQSRRKDVYGLCRPDCSGDRHHHRGNTGGRNLCSRAGASSYTYAEAQWHQDLPNWTGGHVRAWFYFGGVTECSDRIISYVKLYIKDFPASQPPRTTFLCRSLRCCEPSNGRTVRATSFLTMEINGSGIIDGG